MLIKVVLACLCTKGLLCLIFMGASSQQKCADYWWHRQLHLGQAFSCSGADSEAALVAACQGVLDGAYRSKPLYRLGHWPWQDKCAGKHGDHLDVDTGH